MTREEAIEQLRNLSQANFYPRTIMALDMAIEALQNPSAELQLFKVRFEMDDGRCVLKLFLKSEKYKDEFPEGAIGGDTT